MVEARGWAEKFEKLACIIPGMKGYQDKEAFRDTDKAVRLKVAMRLGDVKTVLDDAKRELVDVGKIMDLDVIDRAHRKIQKLEGTVRTDSYGYSGYFDRVKIREPELEKLYLFDLNLFDDVDNLRSLAEGVGGAEDVKASIKALENGIRQFEDVLQTRRDFSVPAGE